MGYGAHEGIKYSLLYSDESAHLAADDFWHNAGFCLFYVSHHVNGDFIKEGSENRAPSTAPGYC